MRIARCGSVPPTRDEYARILLSLVEPGIWTAGPLQVSHDFIEIRGWVIAPQGDHTRVSFMVNDYEFDQIEYPTPREDIDKLYWYIPGARDSGFICRANISKETIFAKGYAVLKCVDKETKQSFNSDHDLYYEVAVNELLPMPDADRMKKVQASDLESVFMLVGFETYKKLELALNRTLGMGYGDFSRILDWGCGCGRTTRYFVNQKGASITGIDIDSDNVRWCEQNLPFGRFLEIPLHPPTSLESSSFDLLIGISVFTHLREKEQFEWLNELRRIASDGAILLMTFHGDTSVCRANLDPMLFHSLRTRGFLDAGSNPDLYSVMKGNDYYRNALHTREYVMKRWSKYFDIIDIIPGYIGNLQDLAIMRKRAF
jgi:ubiquinone/menaquinone biosynthesis C-methylase UbiE